MTTFPITKLTGPTVTATPKDSIPSSASIVDETSLAPKINQIIDALNALGVQVALIANDLPAVTGPTIDITAEQELALSSVVGGEFFTLRSPPKPDGSYVTFVGRMAA